MKFIKVLTLCILMATMCFSAVVTYGAYSIEEFGIANIDIPENYISCTRDACDPELQNILSQNGFAALTNWVAGVMAPANYYVYACDKDNLTNCMYLVCEKLNSPKTRDNLVSHKLAKDYNLIESTAEKAKFLDEMKRAATTDNAQWISLNETTPYVEYFSAVGENRIHAYETIYNGNKITLQFSSAKDFSNEDIQKHLAVFSSVKHSETVDYTEIKEKISSARQKKLEEETHSGKNTRVLRIIIGCSVAFVIVFAVYMAIRSQKKKRKKTIVLREHEVVDEDTYNE